MLYRDKIELHFFLDCELDILRNDGMCYIRVENIEDLYESIKKWAESVTSGNLNRGGSLDDLFNRELNRSSFFQILIHLYGIWVIVHAWDFLVIDGLAMLLTNPLHPPIRGTENAIGWRDYAFHFKSFIRAVMMSAIFVLPIVGPPL